MWVVIDTWEQQLNSKKECLPFKQSVVAQKISEKFSVAVQEWRLKQLKEKFSISVCLCVWRIRVVFEDVGIKCFMFEWSD